MPRGRKPGTKITYTPQETGRYRSQWLRFEKGVRLDHQKVGENEWQVESGRSPTGHWTVKYESSGSAGFNNEALLGTEITIGSLPGLPPDFLPPLGPHNESSGALIEVTILISILYSLSYYSTDVPLEFVMATGDYGSTGLEFTLFTSTTTQVYAASRSPYEFPGLPYIHAENLVDTVMSLGGAWAHAYGGYRLTILSIGSGADPDENDYPEGSPVPFGFGGGAPGPKKWNCNCPDYSRKEPATGRFASEQGARDWSSSNAGSGRVGNEQQFCKHIHSVRASLNLPANVSAEDWKVMENWKEYVDQALRNRAQHRKRKRRKGKGGSDAAYKRYQRWLDRTARRGGLSREERKQRDARRKQERKAVAQAFKQRQDAKVRRQAEKRAIDQRANNYRDRYVRGESIDSIIQDAKRTNNQKAFDQFYKGVS